MRNVKYFLTTVGAIFIVSLGALFGQEGNRASGANTPPSGSAPSKSLTPLNNVADLKKLEGIVIIGSYKDFKPLGEGGAANVVVKGPPFLKRNETAVSTMLQPWLGQTLTSESLSNMQVSIVRLCRKLDRPMVDVYYPEQEVINGTVQIYIVESKVGKVSVQYLGRKWYSDRFITNRVHLHPGDSISQKQLLKDIEQLNHNPVFREVDGSFSQGVFSPKSVKTNDYGVTDITLTVKDRFPLRVFAGFDDYGLKVLGEDQIFGGFNYGNVFGIDHQINYQYLTDTSFQLLQSHSASYVAPLPWGHTLTFFGGYNTVKAELSKIGFSSINNNGDTYQASMRYDMPLPNWGGLVHDVSVGYDFKSADTAVQYNKFNFAKPFLADIDQFVLDYRCNLKDRIGYTAVELSGYYSPGGLLGENEDANFASFHSGLQADYYYGRVTAERGFSLPEGLLLIGKAGYQRASTGLLPSEDLYLGGNSLLRGYPENIESGDNGYYAVAELHSPLIRTGNLTRQQNVPGVVKNGDTLDIFGFFDYGSVQALSPYTPTTVNLSSVGAGLNYRMSQNLVVNFSYGFQLENLPSSVPRPLTTDKGWAYVSATISY